MELANETRRDSTESGPGNMRKWKIFARGIERFLFLARRFYYYFRAFLYFKTNAFAPNS